MDPTVRMKVLQDGLCFPFYGGIAKLYLSLSLSPLISPVFCASYRVIRITQGWLGNPVLPDPASGASLIALFQKDTAISLPLPLPSSF